MTKQEAAKILSLLSMTYRREFSGLSKEDGELFIGMWQKAFADTGYEDVLSAVQNYIFTDRTGFAPVIGKIKAEMEKANPQSTWELNRRPYPQSFIDTVHRFLAEEEAAGRYHRQALI